MQRYFLELAYLGTDFFGWQIQPNDRTVQEEIERVLEQLYQNSIRLTGCGRTDTGVHASQYFAHFDADTRFPEEKLLHKLNTMLTRDIAILKCFKVDKNLHARFDANKRSYTYFLNQEKDPFKAKLSWHKKLDLDLGKMNEAAKLCLGKQDFECFSKVHTEVNNFICEIFAIHWVFEKNQYVFYVTANRFLRNMVRAMVGTFIEVGLGKISIADFKRILESKNRSNAGMSVPAHGLFLSEVTYKDLPADE